MNIQKDVMTACGKKVETYTRFDTYEECIRWAATAPMHPKWLQENYRDGNVDRANKEFTGVNTFKEAEELAYKGWPEGTKLANNLLASIEERIIYSRARVHHPEYAITGGTPDVGVFLSNDPECFLKKEAEAKEGVGKLVRINVNVCCSAVFSPTDMMRRGIAVMALVDLIERTGRSAEIVATSSQQHMDQILEFEVPLKNFGAQLEMDRIAFALGHPAFFRRILFSCMTIAGVGDDDASGYGWPIDSLIPERGDYYFPAMDARQCPTGDEELAAWIIQMLADQGVEIEL
jgi:hypothetical protein